MRVSKYTLIYKIYRFFNFRTNNIENKMKFIHLELLDYITSEFEIHLSEHLSSY